MDDFEDPLPCPACDGPCAPLGTLGSTTHYRCRACGWMTAQTAPRGSDLMVTSSGAESWQNRAGRCEDAPCCGCCSR
jgi:hypothetical protein